MPLDGGGEFFHGRELAAIRPAEQLMPSPFCLTWAKDSPALGLGFVPIDLSSVGPRTAEARH